MDSFPPEVRQLLIELLVTAIRELIALITHLVSEVIGVRTIPPPNGAANPA